MPRSYWSVKKYGWRSYAASSPSIARAACRPWWIALSQCSTRTRPSVGWSWRATSPRPRRRPCLPRARRRPARRRRWPARRPPPARRPARRRCRRPRGRGAVRGRRRAARSCARRPPDPVQPVASRRSTSCSRCRLANDARPPAPAPAPAAAARSRRRDAAPACRLPRRPRARSARHRPPGGAAEPLLERQRVLEGAQEGDLGAGLVDRGQVARLRRGRQQQPVPRDPAVTEGQVRAATSRASPVTGQRRDTVVGVPPGHVDDGASGSSVPSSSPWRAAAARTAVVLGADQGDVPNVPCSRTRPRRWPASPPPTTTMHALPPGG